MAGPALEQRCSLFDFVVAELRQREELNLFRIRPVRRALDSYWQRWNQLHGKLSEKFQGVLDVVVEAMKHIPGPAQWLKTSTHGRWLR